MNRIVVKLFPVLVTVLLVCAPRAHGITTPWGDPVIGHSWDQLWVQTSDQAFDTITATIFLPPETVFENPGMFGFSVDGWAVQTATSHEITSAGSDTTRLEFKTHFSGFPGDYTSLGPLIVDMRIFNDGAYVEGHRWIWDGVEWVDPPLGAPGVPDGGATLALLSLSAAGLAWVRRKLIK